MTVVVWLRSVTCHLTVDVFADGLRLHDAAHMYQKRSVFLYAVMVTDVMTAVTDKNVQKQHIEQPEVPHFQTIPLTTNK